jgi:hypothetical protein
MLTKSSEVFTTLPMIRRSLTRSSPYAGSDNARSDRDEHNLRQNIDFWKNARVGRKISS